MSLYVWSGKVRGVEVDTDDPDEAVVCAVRRLVDSEGYALLGCTVRVSCVSSGPHELDVYYRPPYEEDFPELFDGSLDVRVIPVEEGEEP